MKKNQIPTKECAYLIYSYASISSFTLMTISRITETLEKALNFNPIVSLVIILNMIVFVSLYVYKKNHSVTHK